MELEEVRKATRQFDLVFVPIEEKKTESPWDKEAVIIGDADREMRNTLVKGERRFQLD